MTFLTRFLQVLLAMVFAVAAVLWFAARRGDRGAIEAEIDIARPPAVVFRWISSEDLVRRWITNLVEFKRADVPGEKVPDFRMVHLVNGRPVAIQVRIIRVVPNQELGLQINSVDPTQGGFTGEAGFELIGSGDYTRLVFRSHTKFVSLGDRIWEPLWTYAARSKMKDDLAKLKLLLEAEPANSPNLRAKSPTLRANSLSR